MINHIEAYNGVLKIVCNPTKLHPNGYFFYISEEDKDILQGYNWSLISDEHPYVYASKRGEKTVYLHQLIMLKQGVIPEGTAKGVVHLNNVLYDCRRDNLVMMTKEEYLHYKPSRGYDFFQGRCMYQPLLTIEGKRIASKCVHDEVKAAIQARELELQYLNIPYDFKSDFRGSESLLDYFIRGKMSYEEAVLNSVVKRMNKNAWLVYRYDLENYLRKYGIPTPAFSLGADNRMLDKGTKQILCPFG